MKHGPAPSAGFTAFKAHGLGNDYLVVDEGDHWTLTPEMVARVCHRTRGAGSDGIVWVGAGGAPFRMRGFNPDGSEFERSGNGLRVLGAWLHRAGRVGDAPFQVEVGGDTVEMQVLAADGDTYDIVVDMGACTVRPEERFRLDGPGRSELALVRASVGNPHAVVWGDPDPWTGRRDAEAFHPVGASLAVHPDFPEGTNVQLARVVDPGTLHALVWERGVGPTEASGTSACAVAATAVATGRVQPGELTVRMEGGDFQVWVDPELNVRLRGPVEVAWEGVLARGLLR